MNICVALGGNPNSGKTTLFNELTGSKQHVANYPGVTVEKKEGIYKIDNATNIKIVDLPGIYSLTAYSMEEVVARDFLINEKPNVIVNIVDSSNLERNLYLTLQLLELGMPTCIALNMIDVAKNRGITINAQKLSKILETPVIPIIARTSLGKTTLIKTIYKIASSNSKNTPLRISYGPDLESTISAMELKIKNNQFMTEIYSPRWLAIKYLENDKQIISKGNFYNSNLSDFLKSKTKKISTHIEKTLETYPEAIIADHRYGYINSILKRNIMHERYDKYKSNRSDQIDKVLVNRFAGPIIMLLVLVGLYHFTFTYSKIPIELLNSVFECLGNAASNNIDNNMLKSLIVSGIINGVGGVLGFVPLILFMFFGISILEDSGYLARVAFMMDRVFQTFGLHGSSVMPYIISGGIAGGCAVPGVMATRTLRSSKERLATLLTVPFMNCGAKLPILTLLIAAFFNENNTEIMLLLTAISWLSALFIAKLLRTTVIRGNATPFVMELPPYRLPTFKGLLIHTWERTRQYIKKAGTIILIISIILWALMTFPKLQEDKKKEFDIKHESMLSALNIENAKINPNLNEIKKIQKNIEKLNAEEIKVALMNSIAGQIGTKLENISKLAGFDWRVNIALLGGFAAKEVILSTLGTVYSLEESTKTDTKPSSLVEILRSEPEWRPLSAFSLTIFIMFYAPCSATTICIIKESSLKWGLFSTIFNTSIAFILAIFTYQLGTLLGY